ncbi:MAG: OmpA family protein [Ignavibacteriae bacterium]|nr:OmpA family protein [Ignavibacteriota bacterium]MCB9260122.1 OmpA family protein [Ignavibacteriales bacterium]
MRKKEFIITLLIFFALSIPSYAQLNDYSVKGGIQGFALLPDMDFPNEDIKPSYLGRLFVRIKVIDLFDVELGAGYGKLSGDDPSNDLWESTIMPADLRLLLSPFNSKVVNPYGFAGFGYMKWKVDNKPNQNQYASPYSGVKEDGYEWHAPVGLGMEIKLSNSLLLDLSGGYTFTFTDDLEYFNTVDSPLDGSNDGYWNAGIGLVFTGESGSSDSDIDGLTLDQEESLGTNPDLPDTDGDGLIDGLEFNQYKTDPLKTDSDNDGLSDNDEVKNYTTNPNLADTDKDGISDGDEVLKYKTDPLRVDSDFDGINDNDEIQITKTNPSKSDTDGDGLKDGDERDKYKTSPTLTDTDEDSIPDGDEILKYNTNPNKKDTDGGTTDDYTEISRGTNPLNPEDDVILDIKEPIVLEGVTFATGSSELTPESEKMLLKVLNTLNAYPEMNVEIRGYTDNVGKASSNQALSQRRANSVRYWLLNKGVNQDRVVAKGYGEQNPIADNNTADGRRLNRRIEFVKID